MSSAIWGISATPIPIIEVVPKSTKSAWRLVLVVPEEGHGRHVHHKESTLRGLPLVATGCHPGIATAIRGNCSESRVSEFLQKIFGIPKSDAFLGETHIRHINALLGYPVSWQSHKWSNHLYTTLETCIACGTSQHISAPWCTGATGSWQGLI